MGNGEAVVGNKSIVNIRHEWAGFYRRYFQMVVDFSDVVIPDDPGGFSRVIFIPKGLTIAAVVNAMRTKSITIVISDDADGALKGHNVREADHNYAVCFRDRQEADEELENCSFNKLKADGINSVTLMERLVYGFKFWSENEDGQHLDVFNVTVCAGSQYADGGVPDVHWNIDYRKVYVSWCHPDDARVHLRSRQAVSN